MTYFPQPRPQNQNFLSLQTGNVFFANHKTIYKYLFATKKASVEKQKVIGDLSTSYANYDVGTINKHLLPNYDPSNISFAYTKADGSLTPNYEQAQNTFYNPGRIVALYDDGFGNTFRSEEMARASLDSRSFEPITYSLDADFITKKGDGEVSVTTKTINPFNKGDFNDFKDSIKNNIDPLIKKYRARRRVLTPYVIIILEILFLTK